MNLPKRIFSMILLISTMCLLGFFPVMAFTPLKTDMSTFDPTNQSFPTSGDTIKIGVFEPLTGPSAISGEIYTLTMGWAVHDINAQGGIMVDGKMTNSSFLDYRMPTALDVPMIDTVIVEVANPGHPFGVRGVGEVNIAPPPAALANAISQAIDVRMTRLPMNPNAVMEAQWANGGSNGA